MAQPHLKERFAELQAERARSWTPEQLARNAGQRATLVRRYDAAKHVQAGDILPPFTLVGADGAAIASDDLLANGPAVLVFFRFGGCPACNIALPYYDETLWPAVSAAGIPLVAVSPQVPVDATLAERHGLRLTVAGDPGYALGRALGITFLPDERPAAAPGESWIGATLGTDSYEQAQPTLVILDRDRTVRFIAVSPDWLDRPEAGAVLSELPEAVYGVTG